MSLTPTMRRNGQEMVTFTVKVHLTGSDLAFILATRLDSHGLRLWDETSETRDEHYRKQTAKVSKAKMEKWARNHFPSNSHENLWCVSEDHDGERLVRIAAERIRQLYPTMTVDV